MNSIKKLLEPGRIGNLELKNRVIYSAMDLRSTDRQGHISEGGLPFPLLNAARHGVGWSACPASILTSRKRPPRQDHFTPERRFYSPVHSHCKKGT